MIGSMISFDEKLNKNVPWIHVIWAYPMFWLGILILVVMMIVSIPFFAIFGRFIENAEYEDSKWYDKAIGWPIIWILNIPSMLGFICITNVDRLNKYYDKKEVN